MFLKGFFYFYYLYDFLICRTHFCHNFHVY
nr:MAG TPA: hypothetical protein [Caudoviricetes sp.]